MPSSLILGRTTLEQLRPQKRRHGAAARLLDGYLWRLAIRPCEEFYKWRCKRQRISRIVWLGKRGCSFKFLCLIIWKCVDIGDLMRSLCVNNGMSGADSTRKSTTPLNWYDGRWRLMSEKERWWKFVLCCGLFIYIITVIINSPQTQTHIFIDPGDRMREREQWSYADVSPLYVNAE